MMLSNHDNYHQLSITRIDCAPLNPTIMILLNCAQYFSLINLTMRHENSTDEFEFADHVYFSRVFESSFITIHFPIPIDNDTYWFAGNIFGFFPDAEEIFPSIDPHYLIVDHGNSHDLKIRSDSNERYVTYTCMHKEGETYKDYTIVINVQEIPKFSNFSQRCYGPEGGEAILRCNIDGLNETNVKVYWKRHDELLQPSSRYTIFNFENSYFLKIKKLRPTDNGVYFCSFNIYYERKKRITLYVKPMPITMQRSTPIFVHEGGDLQISCPAKKFEKIRLAIYYGRVNAPDYIGYFDAHYNEPVNFNFYSVTEDKYGYYDCEVQNGTLDLVTRSYSVIVIEKKPKLVSQNQFIYTYQGAKTELSCRSSFRSLQKIVWRFKDTQEEIARDDEIEDVFSARFSLKTDEYFSNLSIFPAEFRDTTTYICHLDNQTAEIKLRVRGVPQVHGCSYKEKIILGSVAKIECRHENASGLEMTWIHNGSRLEPNFTRYEVDNGDFISILTIEDAYFSDSGNYTQCFKIGNTNCSDSTLRPISLIVESNKNMLKNENKFEFLTEGDGYELVCRVDELDAGKNLCWVLPDESVEQCLSENVSKERYNLTATEKECNISISNLKGDHSTHTHSGQYTCQLDCSAQDESYVVSYNLRVTSGPKITHEVYTVNALIGDESSIWCEVINPDEREIILMKVNGPENEILLSEYMREGEKFKLVYKIPTVQESDGGNYLFKFSPLIKEGHELGEIKIKLNVFTMPKFVNEVETINAFIGHDCLIQCEVFNPDGREILLLKMNGSDYKVVKSEVMQVGERHKMEYRVLSIEKNDEKNYQCKFNPSFKHGHELGEMKIQLNIIKAPFISMWMDGEEKVGKNAKLSCTLSNINNFFGDLLIQWWKEQNNEVQLISDNQNLLVNSDHLGVYGTRHRSFLSINPILNNDCGKYTCTINTYPLFSKSITLDCVKLPIVNLENLYAVKGMNIELKMKIPDNSEDSLWLLRKLNDFTNMNDEITSVVAVNFSLRYEVIREDQYSILRIINASEHDTGIYRNLFTGIAIYQQVVQVIDPPTVTARNVVALHGQATSLTCKITNINKNLLQIIKVTWLKNEGQIGHTDQEYTFIEVKNLNEYSSTISIVSSNTEYQGNYTCLLEGIHPRLKKTIQLIVID